LAITNFLEILSTVQVQKLTEISIKMTNKHDISKHTPKCTVQQLTLGHFTFKYTESKKLHIHIPQTYYNAA